MVPINRSKVAGHCKAWEVANELTVVVSSAGCKNTETGRVRKSGCPLATHHDDDCFIVNRALQTFVAVVYPPLLLPF